MGLIENIPDNEKAKVRLAGEDGNAFAIIGRVRKAWKAMGREDVADEYTQRATGCGSYQALLGLTMIYVNHEAAFDEEE